MFSHAVHLTRNDLRYSRHGNSISFRHTGATEIHDDSTHKLQCTVAFFADDDSTNGYGRYPSKNDVMDVYRYLLSFHTAHKRLCPPSQCSYRDRTSQRFLTDPSLLQWLYCSLPVEPYDRWLLSACSSWPSLHSEERFAPHYLWKDECRFERK